MLRSGNRFHFVPSNRSMSPIIARRSYLFGCRSQVNDVRCSAAIRPSMPAPQRSWPICVMAIASERAVNDCTIANRPVTGAHYLRLRHIHPGAWKDRIFALKILSFLYLSAACASSTSPPLGRREVVG
jgi:hypothetical protein